MEEQKGNDKQTNKQTNRFSGTARLIACMLAVLMLTRAAAFSPAVFADGEGIAVMAAKEATSIVLREYEEPFTLTYNYDGKSVKQLLIDNLIDWESSKLPSDSITIDNFNVKTPVAGIFGTSYKDINNRGVSLLPAGESVEITIQFKGNKACAASNTVKTTVSVNKADATIKINSQSIYAGEQPGEDFVTTSNTAGAPDIKYINIYAALTSGRDNATGATKGITSSIYVQPSALVDAASNTTMTALKAGVALILSKHPEINAKNYKDLATKGISFAEVKIILPELVNLVASKLDTETAEKVNKLVDIVTKYTGFADDIMIYAGTAPTHAGVYTTFAYVIDSNYNSDLAMGTLTVKMRTKDMKIDLNEILSRRVISAEQAGILASGEKGAVATLRYNGQDVDQANLHYLYSGVTKSLEPYSSTTEFPTEPGRYTVTIVTLGGDYLASPVTRSFQIK